MLQTDPIVLKYPQYLPTEEEVDGALRLLDQAQHKELKEALSEHICIGRCAKSAVRRFCWQAREDHKSGDECAEGALAWLSRCVAARKKLKVDSLLYNGPFSAEFRNMYLAAMPFSVHRTDKQGHPVLIARYGSIDLKAFCDLWAEGEALQKRAGLEVNGAVLFHIRAMEYITQVVMAEETERQGRVVDRILAIMDMGGLGMKHLNSPLKTFLGAVSKESVPLFPETMHATVLANVPWLVAKAAWPIAKTFLHPVTQDKFIILSSAAELQAKLLELLAPEDIPPYFGGSCKCAECAADKLQGGSMWTWEQEQGIHTSAPKARVPPGPPSSPTQQRTRRFQPAEAEGTGGGPASRAAVPAMPTATRSCSGVAENCDAAVASASAGEREQLLIVTDSLKAEPQEVTTPGAETARGLSLAWSLLPLTVAIALFLAILVGHNSTGRVSS